MKKKKPTWPAETMKDFITWDNVNNQIDPTEGLQLQGKYLGYTLSLSLCKNSDLEGRIGREISPSICKAWVTVGTSGIKNAGLGLFAATRFYRDDIVTIYFAPKKSITPPKREKFTALKYGIYHTLPIEENGQPPYYMGAHFTNDATWHCKPDQVKNLERSNNCYWDGFIIKAKNLITIGEEICIGYNHTQYKPKSKKIEK